MGSLRTRGAFGGVLLLVFVARVSGETASPSLDVEALSPCEAEPVSVAGRGLDGDEPPLFAPEASFPALETSPDASPEGAAPESGPSLKDMGTMALKDTVTILGAPLHWTAKNWLVFGGIAAGVVAVGFAFDYPMRNKTQANQTQALDDMTKVVEPFGSEYSWAVIGAYGIAGFLFHAPDAKNIFFDSVMASILASGIITPTLKFVIGRERPDESVSDTSFHPFSGSDNSFPSGHATQAFAVASVISAHSDQVWVSVTAYTLAGLVGFARIYHNAHWTSDVTAGALIGTFVGRGVVALNNRLRKGEGKVQVSFAPFFDEHTRGAAVFVEF
jgi:membrane-associated phospholipid phosphatase